MLPRIKEYKNKGDKIYFNDFCICGDGENKKFGEIFLSFFVEKELLVPEGSDNGLKIEVREEPKRSKGAYGISVDNGVLISFCGTEGLRNALSTLVQLISFKNGRYFIEKCEINDYPDSEFRSVMIDLARGIPSMERLCEDIKRLALAKCNNITLHLMDGEGICYKSDVLELEGDIRGTKLYTKEELKTVVDFCGRCGINVIPGIEVPAHADSLTRKQPSLKCKTKDEKPRYWTVCAGEEATYEFYSKLIDEICSMFPGEYIHAGGDELYFNDFPQWDMFCYWEECETCRNIMKKNGISGMRGMYYYLINRINEIVNKRDKKMVIYNDQLDLSKEVSIDRNIIVQFWRVSNENRGPRKGCSMNELLKQGFKVINSAVEICYIDLEDYANPEKISAFSYKDYPKNEFPENIIGGEACAWEYGNPSYTHYKLSFSCSAALILDKLWDTKDVCYDQEYRRSLTKFLLGYKLDDEYDLPHLFGSVMPPRKNDIKSYATVGNELMSREELELHKKTIDELGYTYSEQYKQYINDTMFEDLFENEVN